MIDFPYAIQRSVVWLGATVLVAYLKKPDGATLLAMRTDPGVATIR